MKSLYKSSMVQTVKNINLTFNQRLKYVVLFVLLFPQSSIAKNIILNEKIAQVNNEAIFKIDLDNAVAQYITQAKMTASAAKKQAFQDLLKSKLFISRGETDVIIDENYINIQYKKQMDSYIKNFGSEANLEKASGMQIDVLRKLIKKSMKERYVVDFMREKITKNVSITIDEVKEFVVKNQNLLPEHNEQIILTRYAKVFCITSQEKERMFNKFKFIRQELNKGKSFEELAILYSEDKFSFQGGDIEFYWAVGDLIFPSEYERAATKLVLFDKTKDINLSTSNIIITHHGMYLIQLRDIKDNKYRTRHIFIRAHDEDLQKKNALDELLKLKQNLIDNNLSLQSKIEKLSIRDKSFTDSGFLLNKKNDIRFEKDKDEIPEYLPKNIFDLPKGTFVGPIFAKTLNDSSLQLFQIIDKFPKRKLNLMYDYKEISDLLLAKKKNSKIKDWLKTAANASYIYINPKYKHLAVEW